MSFAAGSDPAGTESNPECRIRRHSGFDFAAKVFMRFDRESDPEFHEARNSGSDSHLAGESRSGGTLQKTRGRRSRSESIRRSLHFAERVIAVTTLRFSSD